MLELLDLELLEVTGLGEAEGVEAATGGHVADPVHANVLTNAASGFGFY